MVVEKAFRGLAIANLKSLRFLSRPERLVGYLRDVEETYQLHTCLSLESVELADILGKRFAQALFLPLGHVRSGSTPVGDLAALAALTQKKNPGTIFEIGTFEGLSTVVFVKNAGSGVKMHTLDLPHGNEQIARTKRSFAAHSISDPYVSGHLIDQFSVRHLVQALWGDSAIFDFEPFHGTIDLFFVDGAHTEDYVAADSCRAFDCITEDGWVLWHDCFTPQVMKVIKDIARSTRIYQIRGTNLALAMGKPNVDLRTEYKKIASSYT